MEGGPVLGYVPVMYPHHDGPPLAFRANDVTALNVAWQFFVNGLDYSFSVWMEDPEGNYHEMCWPTVWNLIQCPFKI